MVILYDYIVEANKAKQPPLSLIFAYNTFDAKAASHVNKIMYNYSYNNIKLLLPQARSQRQLSLRSWIASKVRKSFTIVKKKSYRNSSDKKATLEDPSKKKPMEDPTPTKPNQNLPPKIMPPNALSQNNRREDPFLKKITFCSKWAESVCQKQHKPRTNGFELCCLMKTRECLNKKIVTTQT